MKYVLISVFLLMRFGAYSQSFEKLIKKGELKKMDELITKDPSLINKVNKVGATPLHIAAGEGQYEIAELLIQKGASLDAQNNFNSTPLDYAIESKKIEVAELLVRKGANTSKFGFYGKTPLHYAAEEGLYDLVSFLLKNGVPVDIKDKAGNQPLFYASNIMIADLLIRNGADVNARNNYGSTPLHDFLSSISFEINGKTDLIEFLIEKGANVNLKNYQGQTPLDCYRYGGYTNPVVLINNGGLLGTKLDSLNRLFHPNFQYLKNGLSADDVIDLIGPPHKVETSSVPGFDKKIEIWHYWINEDIYELYFITSDETLSIAKFNSAPETIKLDGFMKGKLSAMYKNKEIINFTPVVTLSDMKAKVSAFKFYEGGFSGVAKNDRNYTNHFIKNQTHYVYWELDFEHPVLGKRTDFVLKVNYYKSDGSVLCHYNYFSYIDSDWTNSYHFSGWGNKQAGVAFNNGLYTVKLFLNDDEIASGQFEVTDQY